MHIAIHDADAEHFKHKTFPNYALMKISAWHKAQGDTVEWWNPLDTYDKVYSSKIFDFTPENPYLPAQTIKGGTGYDVAAKLPQEIDDMFPDYSIYPECDYAIGFITRGCIRNCPWCVVPKKEGGIAPYRTWEQLVRSDTNKLVLMDNNILACEHGIEQLRALIGTNIRIDLNQGMDARLVDDRIADILASLKWIKSIRFSCDTVVQIEPIKKTARLLRDRGVKVTRLFIYLLVTKDIADAEKRVRALNELGGLTIYAQAERNPSKGIMPNAMQKEFADRYVYSGCYRRESWDEYCCRKKLKFDEVAP